MANDTSTLPYGNSDLEKEVDKIIDDLRRDLRCGPTKIVTSMGFAENWLPEKRARYNAKRRQKDLDFINSRWNTPIEILSEKRINIEDVPTKVAKKYKREIAVHGSQWREMDAVYVRQRDSKRTSSEKSDCIMGHSNVILEQMEKKLPTFQSRSIIDIPPNFRQSSGTEISGKEISGKGMTQSRVWNNYRLAVYYNSEGIQCDDKLCLHYIDEALSFLPPLLKGEIPHKEEVWIRNLRAVTLMNLRDYEGALVDYRICLAAVRLLDHSGKVDLTDKNDPIIQKLDGWSHSMIRCSIKAKVCNGVPRPYFSKDELLDIMKEHGYGMYAPGRLKCSGCSKRGLEVRLFLCSKCKEVWYCGKDCATKAWKGGHKESCGFKQYLHPMKMPPAYYRDTIETLNEARDDGAHGIAFISLHLSGIFGSKDKNRDFLVLCKDPSTGEIFDGLTDENIDLQEDTNVHEMHNLDAMKAARAK